MLARWRTTLSYTRPPTSRCYAQPVKLPTHRNGQPRRRSPYPVAATTAGVLAASTLIISAYYYIPEFRHSVLAGVRCSRIAEAAILDAIDYKWTLTATYPSEEDADTALRRCHTRCAVRVRQALLANGGVFIKLGQHASSLLVLPTEWRSALRPLQDQCEATPYEDLVPLFEAELGRSPNELFEYLDPTPIGTASLAQVHVGRMSGQEKEKKVAVKVQHPHIAEFCDVDMDMVEFSLGWIKYWFPEFEFTWLGDEMRQNLPREIDFIHEAENAKRATADFANVRTSLHIPEVLLATKRLLIMEFIDGGRVDDLDYLAAANIDRNKVAVEISRIFGRMLHITGFFHADAHPGNILIRPSPPFSKSPYNFEICLLDHGLYFDLSDELRLNYAKFCLALMAPGTPEIVAERKRLAFLVGNIGPDLYPIFEAALTGRANLEGSSEGKEQEKDESANGAGGSSSVFKRAGSMLDMMPHSEAEMDFVRNAVMQRDGMVFSILDLLRQIPRRMLMVLKVNDLSRTLDYSLMTTHSHIRVFLVTAQYCGLAVWEDDRRRILSEVHQEKRWFALGGLVMEYAKCWWRYRARWAKLSVMETVLDWQAWNKELTAWLKTKGYRDRQVVSDLAHAN